MVTDEERDYMYAEYAKDPRMKANIGIRRRLAPLLDNDRNQIELFTALLLSLPGSPVLYYGDEIGMGDNIWLGDRDGVRTPDAVDARPQRRLLPRRPGRLYLPVIMDPLYGYQAVNVEAQIEQHRLAAALDPADDRGPQAHPAFGLGRLPRARRLEPVACWRTSATPTATTSVLCVNNLSRFPQPVELDLSAVAGLRPASS